MQPIFNGIFLLGLALTASQAGAQYLRAPVVHGNIPVTYKATLLDKNTTGIRGTISGSGGPDGVGAKFRVNFTGFPDESLYGPFIYHIHMEPVPEDGNCTETLSHLDPYNRGEQPACNASEPATCQLGDLSGKHGSIVAVDDEPFFAEYIDYYLSTTPDNIAFFGNLSVVVHTANATRLNCGNFELVEDDGEDVMPKTATATATATVSTTTVTVSPTPAPFHAAAPRTRELSAGAAILAGVFSVAVWVFT
ncbi:Superoxide dismutase Cu-Zn [Rasamsonia emersonii CBS 393.64]|uniref:superoxide dismutase n=1 Tax=Rasamsonia emersonii (strain ATCC 16479 / CBS 393.64 / IMI 116815) TaxID=1408163 RepID=A0A0F4Z384_RASE3|nr:Superoxide dismutase Cu-Zn [Rasamsonia emersonii CBS 393.64]KKA24967.1 Superoxide dismutase Cu-Zn [Rasamsonia emersonii CBS 393.64]